MMTPALPKNSKHLVELIYSATISSLLQLATVNVFSCLKPIDLNKPDAQVRATIRQRLAALPLDVLSIADQDAVRLLQLLRFRTEEMLAFAGAQLHAQGKAQKVKYDCCADPMTRLIWFRVYAPQIFDLIETIYLTHHFYGHRKFQGFHICPHESHQFQWNSAMAQHLLERILDILRLQGQARNNSQILYFQMDEAHARSPRMLHYLVVYHPGTMKLLRQMKNSRRDLVVFIPALEATLVYDPTGNTVHVLAQQHCIAQQLAKVFVEPISKKKF